MKDRCVVDLFLFENNQLNQYIRKEPGTSLLHLNPHEPSFRSIAHKWPIQSPMFILL